MAFAWKEYLELAHFLALGQNGFSQEAAFRSAVSRAYYAAFCHARNYARDRHGFSLARSPQDHWRVIAHFRSRRRDDIARCLEVLRQWRNRCDYDDVVSGISHVLASILAQAQQVITRLS